MNKIINFLRKKKKKKHPLQHKVENSLRCFEKEHCENCNSDMGWKCQNCYCSTIIFVLDEWLSAQKTP